MSAAKRTVDHEEIRSWANERGGRPARVKGTGDGDHDGVLRIDFDGPDDALEAISWEDFFEVFEDRGLALVYQEETEGGKVSRFSKLVSRTKDDD
jgi:hypothetical protein